MDIFSHGLWGYGAAKLARRSPRLREVKPVWAGFWGVFPDLFAFTPIFAWLWWGRLTGAERPNFVPKPEDAEPFAPGGHPMFELTQNLYSLSHSLVVWAAVLLAAWLILKMLRRNASALLAMGGWALHILMDVPTHTYRFFPTPVFWPVSGWKFDGISWGQPWFMAANYGALLLLFIWLRTQKQKN